MGREGEEGGRWAWGDGQGRVGGEEVGSQAGGMGFCKGEPLILGIPSFDSCQILPWIPVFGGLRILQPRGMEKVRFEMVRTFILWDTRKHQHLWGQTGFRKGCLKESGQKVVSLM